MKLKFNKTNGFTLVELLIVIGIIGILATLLMSNFIGVRQRARDAQRKSDIRQIQSALEIYRSDQDTYPSATNSSVGACASSLTGGSPANTYMRKIPCDPSGSSYQFNNGNYYYSVGSNSYVLQSCLENSSDSQGTGASGVPSGGTTSGCPTNWWYVATNP